MKYYAMFALAFVIYAFLGYVLPLLIFSNILEISGALISREGILGLMIFIIWTGFATALLADIFKENWK